MKNKFIKMIGIGTILLILLGIFLPMASAVQIDKSKEKTEVTNDIDHSDYDKAPQTRLPVSRATKEVDYLDKWYL